MDPEIVTTIGFNKPRPPGLYIFTFRDSEKALSLLSSHYMIPVKQKENQFTLQGTAMNASNLGRNPEVISWSIQIPRTNKLDLVGNAWIGHE